MINNTSAATTTTAAATITATTTMMGTIITETTSGATTAVPLMNKEMKNSDLNNNLLILNFNNMKLEIIKIATNQ
jgi:hypothetical protein